MKLRTHGLLLSLLLLSAVHGQEFSQDFGAWWNQSLYVYCTQNDAASELEVCIDHVEQYNCLYGGICDPDTDSDNEDAEDDGSGPDDGRQGPVQPCAFDDTAGRRCLVAYLLDYYSREHLDALSDERLRRLRDAVVQESVEIESSERQSSR